MYDLLIFSRKVFFVEKIYVNNSDVISNWATAQVVYIMDKSVNIYEKKNFIFGIKICEDCSIFTIDFMSQLWIFTVEKFHY